MSVCAHMQVRHWHGLRRGRRDHFIFPRCGMLRVAWQGCDSTHRSGRRHASVRPCHVPAKPAKASPGSSSIPILLAFHPSAGLGRAWLDRKVKEHESCHKPANAGVEIASSGRYVSMTFETLEKLEAGKPSVHWPRPRRVLPALPGPHR